MKMRFFFTCLALLSVAFSGAASNAQARLFPAAPAATALGTAFTYQGYLEDGGQPADGIYDFKFSLYEDSGGASKIGATQTEDNLNVDHGYFSVELNFGSGAFNGNKR